MRFRRKPGTVEAWRFNGSRSSAEAITSLAGDARVRVYASGLEVRSDRGPWVPLHPGEWLIKVDDADWYPIAHEKFMARYEPDE